MTQCQKTWMLIEEKRIPYRVEKINMRSYGKKPAAFLEKVPNGLLPAIELDGRLMTDSQRIMITLEDMFNGPEYTTASFLPLPEIRESPELQAKAERLLGLERELFGAWCQWCFRPADGPGQRHRAQFEATMAKVEAALGDVPEGPFFLGERLCIVDLVYVPHLERIAASLLYWKAYRIRGDRDKYPLVNAWFDALEERDTYMATQSDFYTHVKDIPPQYGDGYFNDDALRADNAELLGAIDGGIERDLGPGAAGNPLAAMLGLGGGGGAEAVDTPAEWRLPLPAAESCPQTILPANDPGSEEACAQAAERLVHNHEAVVRFALRGAGEEGRPAYSAPLADPNAVPTDDEATREVVDELLRSATAKMLGIEVAEASPALARLGGARDGPSAPAAACIDYLRARVGVPRDMSLPAARQFRAHLTWAMDAAMDCQ